MTIQKKTDNNEKISKVYEEHFVKIRKKTESF